ncbi:EF-hand calcium-binding domain-containing protein 9 [Phlyctochytrium bullatum]|nr:EF-hand calcium-binding domain-containing protein 9 [Phlyctochytrium bullatum]
MKVKWSFIKRLHLDPTYGLLSARSAFLCWEVFKMLDWRGTGSLDDIQFNTFMLLSTDLKEAQIYKVFDIFDLDRSGSVEFDEFYLLMCILVAIKDGQGKQFMYQHWRTCFEILDEDGGKTVSISEFKTLGFLFNFSQRAIRNIYKEFDIAGNSELDYSEFRLFVLAAIDMQSKIDGGPIHIGEKLLNLARRLLNKFCIPFRAANSDVAGEVRAMGSTMGLMREESMEKLAARSGKLLAAPAGGGTGAPTIQTQAASAVNVTRHAASRSDMRLPGVSRSDLKQIVVSAPMEKDE